MHSLSNKEYLLQKGLEQARNGEFIDDNDSPNIALDANENLTEIHINGIHMFKLNGTYEEMMELVDKHESLIPLIEWNEPFDFTKGQGDSSWYWRKSGSYNKDLYEVDQELSGAKFELPTSGVFTKTIEEAQRIAKGVKKTLIMIAKENENV